MRWSLKIASNYVRRPLDLCLLPLFIFIGSPMPFKFFLYRWSVITDCFRKCILYVCAFVLGLFNEAILALKPWNWGGKVCTYQIQLVILVYLKAVAYVLFITHLSIVGLGYGTYRLWTVKLLLLWLFTLLRYPIQFKLKVTLWKLGQTQQHCQYCHQLFYSCHLCY